MITTIKELFTAYQHDGNIYGCRKNHFAWFHEYRHTKQLQVKLLDNLWKWLPYVTGCLGMVMLWFLYLVPQKSTLAWGGIFILPITIFVLGIEIDANAYALVMSIRKGDKK